MENSFEFGKLTILIIIGWVLLSVLLYAMRGAFVTREKMVAVNTGAASLPKSTTYVPPNVTVYIPLIPGSYNIVPVQHDGVSLQEA